MNRNIVRTSIAGAAVAAAISVAVPSAGAVTVPNMFWRTCIFSCSAYVQSNGPYNSGFISECFTKGWFGSITSSYYKWGRC